MDRDLRKWLRIFAAMQNPSVGSLLFKHGYTYESSVLENLLMAFQRTEGESQRNTES